MYQRFYAALWLLTVTAAGAAPSPLPTPPFEITKEHIDVEVFADGSYEETREEYFRVLNAQGLAALNQRRLGYTAEFEQLDVLEAYTRKADGKRIDVPQESYMSGTGESSQPGYRDTKLTSIFFPDVEIGDQVVLVTHHHQIKPWFAGHFDMQSDFGRAVVSHNIQVGLTAPASMALKIDARGLEGGDVIEGGGKRRWSWKFHNDTPVMQEPDAVSETDYGPHLHVTSFIDYAEVAKAYRERSRDRAAVTPEIRALAEDLTKGVVDKRAQAKILYDWVSSHIAYVGIVLGDGGFTPHAAKHVLEAKYGDCKDHVVLLEAFLAARGIASSAVLIDVGRPSYEMSLAPSPHDFDHVVTYLPAFDLYLDSTAQTVPFGVLPYGDTGKPVLRVDDGTLTKTPVAKAGNTTVRTVSEVTISSDGAADGTSTVTASGAYAVDLRGYMQLVPAGKETDFLRTLLGPGVEGTLDRGDPRALADPYVVKSSYHVPSAITLSGPAALSFSLGFKPLSFTTLVTGSLPAARNSNYLCLSIDASEDLTLSFPPGVEFLSVPKTQHLDAEDVHLQIAFDRKKPGVLKQSFALRLDHPTPVCTPAYYRRVHDALAKMADALREQVIYKMKKGT